MVCAAPGVAPSIRPAWKRITSTSPKTISRARRLSRSQHFEILIIGSKSLIPRDRRPAPDLLRSNFVRRSLYAFRRRLGLCATRPTDKPEHAAKTRVIRPRGCPRPGLSNPKSTITEYEPCALNSSKTLFEMPHLALERPIRIGTPSPTPPEGEKTCPANKPITPLISTNRLPNPDSAPAETLRVGDPRPAPPRPQKTSPAKEPITPSPATKPRPSGAWLPQAAGRKESRKSS